MPFLGQAETPRVKNIQSGTITAGASTAQSVTITAIDTSKCVLFWSHSGGGVTPNKWNMRGRIASSTKLEFNTESTADTSPQIYIEWQLVEFEGDISVQNIEETNTLGAKSTTINAVDRKHSFIIHQGMEKGGSSYTDDDVNRVAFTDDTTIRWTGNSTNTGQDPNCQIVTSTACRVQQVTQTDSATTKTTITVPMSAVPIEKTQLFVSQENDTGGAQIDRTAFRAFFVDNANIQMERNVATSLTFITTAFVVTWDTSIVRRVQRGLRSEFGNTDYNETILPIGLERSVVRLIGAHNGRAGGLTSRSNDDGRFYNHRVNFQNESEIRIRRDHAGNYTNSLAYEIIEWVIPGLRPLDVAYWANQAGGGTLNETFSGAGVGSMSTSRKLTRPTSMGGTSSMSISRILRRTVTIAGTSTADATRILRRPLNIAGTSTADAFGGVETDCYPFSNADGAQALWDSVDGLAQSFNGNGGKIVGATFQMQKAGTPAGTVTCKIYAHSGTFGTSSIPTGAALATSTTTVDSADVNVGSVKDYHFAFDGTVTLSSGTKYCVTLEGPTGALFNWVLVQRDASGPTHGGNMATLDAGTWTPTSAVDVTFCVYTESSSGGTTNEVFSAAGTSSMTVSRKLIRTVDIAGTSTMVATIGSLLNELFAAAGTSTMSVVRKLIRTVDITGTSTADATRILRRPLTIAGSSSMTTSSEVKVFMTVLMAGTSTADATRILRRSFSAAGLGGMSSSKLLRRSITIAGVGTMDAVFATEVPDQVLIVLTIAGESSLHNSLYLEGDEVAIEGIWNTALVHLGAPIVSSTSDTTSEAILINAIWEDFWEEFLTDHKWAGAKTTATLSTLVDAAAADVTPPDRWSYAYALPSNYLQAIRVNGRAMQPETTTFVEIESILIDAVYTLALFTNDATCDLEYTFDVGNQVSLLKPKVRQACGMLLAARIAPSFGKTEREIMGMLKRGENMLADARSIDSQERTPSFFAESPLLTSRSRRGGGRR